jgi:hypothetical protein
MKRASQAIPNWPKPHQWQAMLDPYTAELIAQVHQELRDENDARSHQILTESSGDFQRPRRFCDSGITKQVTYVE